MIEVLQFGLGNNPGGIETYLKKINDHIDRTRFHFSFIDMTGEKQPAFYEELKANGCDFYKVTPRNVSAWKNRRDIERLFAEHQFDILHFNVNTLSYATPVYAALRHRCKVIIHSRSAGMTYSPLTAVLHHLNKAIINQKNVTRIGVSREACDWLFGENSESTVYPNGVDTKRFRFDRNKRAQIRSELKCEEKLVIANVGAFLPVKNHEFIVAVYEQIKKLRSDSVLWLIGQGGTMPKIKQLVHEKGLDEVVFFLGKRTEMQDIFAGMDAFLFPSLFEGFGNVLLEAQAEGVPCLSSTAVPEITSVTEYAKRMPLGESAEEWAKTLLELIENSAPLLREKAYLLLERVGWSVESEILRLENLYDSLTQKEVL